MKKNVPIQTIMRNSNDDESKLFALRLQPLCPQKNYLFVPLSFTFEIRFDKMEEKIVEDGVDYFRTD